jgi:integrase/recombinase XerD
VPRRRLPTFLEPHELDALLAAADPRQRLFFLLCARAGLRAFEAAAVRWEDFTWTDDRARTLRIPHGKGDKEALVPVHRSIADALQPSVHLRKPPLNLRSNPAIDRGHLFPGRRPGGHVTTRTAAYWMEAACRRAGIDRRKAHLHSLRHTFATDLLRGDVNLKDVQELMRHSNVQTTSVYLHTTPERLASAVAVLE